MTYRLHKDFILAVSECSSHAYDVNTCGVAYDVNTSECSSHAYDVAHFKTILYLLFAESDDQNYRVRAVHAFVYKLPDKNKEMLDILIKHLLK